MYRPKMGFAVPIGGWFRGPLKDRVAALADAPGLRDSGYFDVATIRKMIRDHQAGLKDHAAVIWSLVMFEASMRQLGVSA